LKADEKIKGIVGEVGLERNEGKFNSFNVTVGLTLKTGALTYAQGERLIAEMRKELLGKAVEIAEIIHLCPVCEKGFNTMQGRRRTLRRPPRRRSGPGRSRLARRPDRQGSTAPGPRNNVYIPASRSSSRKSG